MIIGVGVAAFVGSLSGVYCGIRIMIPTIAHLLSNELPDEK